MVLRRSVRPTPWVSAAGSVAVATRRSASAVVYENTARGPQLLTLVVPRLQD